MERERAIVVAEALPLEDHLGGRRRSGCLDGRPPFEPARVARHDPLDLRLLQHDLADEDRVRVARASPGKLAGVLPVPRQQQGLHAPSLVVETARPAASVIVHGWTSKARGRTSTTRSIGPSPAEHDPARPRRVDRPRSRWRAPTTVTRWGSASSRRSTLPGYGTSENGSTDPAGEAPGRGLETSTGRSLAAEVVPARAGREPDGDAPPARPHDRCSVLAEPGRVLRAKEALVRIAPCRARLPEDYMERQRGRRLRPVSGGRCASTGPS